jgi:lysophospholipase L1-like esterase
MRRTARLQLAAILLFMLVVLAAIPFNHASSRIAFMGDSLTEGWSFPRANFGIFGQTTSQMLSRFPSQICGHGFREVFILGGTNDTLLGVDPQRTLQNLAAMVVAARTCGVDPLLGEIPPIYSSDGQFLPAVAALNLRIVALANQLHAPLVDYYHALLGHPEAYSDGVHLKRRGYLRMEYTLVRSHPTF